jgi:putative membrane protein
MKLIKLPVIACILIGMLSACDNAGGREGRMADSTSLGDRADAAANSDSLPDEVNETSEAGVNDDSAVFMKRAALGGKMEIVLGKAAMEKATNAKVKDFGARMVADHTMASSDLMKLAQKTAILLPTEFPADEKAHMDKLLAMEGAAFDKHYMEMMVKDHVKTIDLFKAATRMRENSVRAYAEKTLPVLEEHHKMATQIYEGLK